MREIFRLPVTFVLDEEVTPEIFAGRVAKTLAIAYALRPGESLEVDGHKFIVQNHSVVSHHLLPIRRGHGND